MVTCILPVAPSIHRLYICFSQVIRCLSSSSAGIQVCHLLFFVYRLIVCFPANKLLVQLEWAGQYPLFLSFHWPALHIARLCLLYYLIVETIPPPSSLMALLILIPVYGSSFSSVHYLWTVLFLGVCWEVRCDTWAFLTLKDRSTYGSFTLALRGQLVLVGGRFH